jgi:cell division protease FtsH
LVQQAYQRAKQLLTDNRHILDLIAQALIERETIDAEELQGIINSNEVRLAIVQ